MYVCKYLCACIHNFIMCVYANSPLLHENNHLLASLLKQTRELFQIKMKDSLSQSLEQTISEDTDQCEIEAVAAQSKLLIN